MRFKYSSRVESIYRLLPWAHNLSVASMEQYKTTVLYGGRNYLVDIVVAYSDVNTSIKATIGDTDLTFEANEAGGIDIKQSGEWLEEGLINEIARAVMMELDNNAIEDDDV